MLPRVGQRRLLSVLGFALIARTVAEHGLFENRQPLGLIVEDQGVGRVPEVGARPASRQRPERASSLVRYSRLQTSPPGA